MMNKKVTIALVLVTAIFILNRCSKSPFGQATTSNATFHALNMAQSISTILTKNASGVLPTYASSGVLNPGAGPTTAGSQRPCAGRTGGPLPDQGSGMCTGNLSLRIPLPTIPFSLTYNSLGASIQYGFGLGMSFLADARFIVLSNGAAVSLLGDGSLINYHPGAVTGQYISDDPRISTSIFNLTAANVTQSNLNGSNSIYLPVSGDSTQYVLSSTTDRNGNNKAFSRNSSGQITQIADNFGNRISISYSSGVATAITDNAGGTYALSYDSSNTRLVKVTQPDSRSSQFTYTGTTAQILSSTTPDAQSYTYAFYPSGDFQSVTDSLGYITMIYYTQSSVMVATSFDNDLEQFNSSGVLTSTSHNGATTVYGLDSNNRVVSITDPSGNVTAMAYDTSDPLANKITYPPGYGVKQYTRNPNRLLIQMSFMRGASNTVMSFLPAQFGLVSSVFRNAGADVTSFTYDSHGNVSTVAKNGFVSERNFYNTNGSLASSTDATGLITSYSYDARGMLASVTDPLGRVTTYTNDPLGNVTQVKTPTLIQNKTYTVMGLPLNTTTQSSVISSGPSTLTSVAQVYNPNGSPEVSSGTNWRGSWNMTETKSFSSSISGNVTSDVLTNSSGASYALGQ